MPVKWIQATNKKEPCKLFIGYNPNDDRTLKDGYKIFWDGKCKNGYAYGLGREFEKGFLTNSEAIALYSGGEKQPEYFIQKDNLSNITIEGDFTNRNFVQTTIEDDGINFDIWYQYGHFQKNIVDIGSFISSNPISDDITYIKAYPNFAYVIGDLSNDEFSQYKYNFNMLDGKTKQLNGFSFSVLKNNIRRDGERINGNLVRHVVLPKSYLNHLQDTLNEIKNAGQVAIDAQKKALIVKQQYKDIICKDSVKVDFMDNNEYKAICSEDKKLAELKKKMDTKLAQIEQQKQAKRQQQNEQRLIQAREAEAQAAQRKAAAAEKANNQAEWDSVNRSIQNMNNNLQMQQQNYQMNNLNNNLENINKNLQRNNNGGYYNGGGYYNR